jgi:hypothetical protein
MLQIINIHKALQENIVKTNLFFENNVIVLEQNNYRLNPNQFFRYISIKKINYISQCIEELKFNKPADLVSLISSSSIIYYAYIGKNKESYFINLRKINCINSIEEDILTIDTEFRVDNGKGYILLSQNSKIIGLSERYIMLAIAQPQLKAGHSYFYKILLIDSIQKKIYPIPDEINKLDTLRRLSQVWLVNNDKSIVFKTGRIQSFEKKQIWKNQKEEGVFKQYQDHLETLILCQVDEFVNNIKSGLGISKDWIIETSNLHTALDVIKLNVDSSNLNKIFYSVESFKDNSTEIKTYNLISHEIEGRLTTECYDFIMCFREKLYGFLMQNGYVDVYNIISKEKVLSFSTYEQILDIDIDSKYFISVSHMFGNNEKTKYTLNINKVDNGNIINTFECNSFYFDYKKDILILIT